MEQTKCYQCAYWVQDRTGPTGGNKGYCIYLWSDLRCPCDGNELACSHVLTEETDYDKSRIDK
jgi:hypothetical protein